MLKKSSKVPVRIGKSESPPVPTGEGWHPFESLRRQMERLFDDFDHDYFRWPGGRSAFDIEPFWRHETGWGLAPAVDVAEKNDAYEISAELPGLDEKDLDVSVVNGCLTIKGEKQEEKEEKKKDYYLHERRFGTFERRFAVPDAVDVDKIEAKFRKGLLTVTLPKKPEARQPEKKIDVKAA